MVTTPDGLTPGPDGTFYGPLGCVPDDWEYRYSADGKWDGYDREGSDRGAVVQARPAPLGAPKGIEFGPDGWLVTTWKHMRGRSDLDQWEYALLGALGSSWTRCNHIAADAPDNFPMIVRFNGGVR